jgi:hypothetical protein
MAYIHVKAWLECLFLPWLWAREHNTHPLADARTVGRVCTHAHMHTRSLARAHASVNWQELKDALLRDGHFSPIHLHS